MATIATNNGSENAELFEFMSNVSYEEFYKARQIAESYCRALQIALELSEKKAQREAALAEAERKIFGLEEQIKNIQSEIDAHRREINAARKERDELAAKRRILKRQYPAIAAQIEQIREFERAEQMCETQAEAGREQI